MLVAKGMVKSRERAQSLILEGKVFVDGRKITKAGSPVSDVAEIHLKENDIPFVSRGGLKLEAALQHFAIDVKNKIALDVGSSSGGFTDCLLKRGARKVYCVDVGYGQLAWSLRRDSRVALLERTNIRHLDRMVREGDPRITREEFGDLTRRVIDMVVIDVSFISLVQVVPETLKFLGPRGKILALVKPQFEVGKGEVGKGGIVREEEKRMAALHRVRQDLEGAGLRTVGMFESPVRGQKGNIEYFLLMEKNA